MPHYDDPFGRRRSRPEMGMSNYPGRGDIIDNRTLGPGAPARPLTPTIGRPDLAPGYIPNPPPSRVRPTIAPPPTRPPVNPIGGGREPIPPSGTFGGYIPPPQRPGGFGALHLDPPVRDPYPDPDRDPRGYRRRF